MIMKILGALLFVDGLLVAFLGKPLIRAVNFEKAPEEYNRFNEWLLAQPDWFIRGFGMVESTLGLWMLDD
jgi:hypothetical protein